MKIYTPEKFDRLPDGILFDTDNTLYEYNYPHNCAMSAVRLKVMDRLSISGGDFDNSFHQAKLEIKNQLGKTASSHSRLLYFQRMLEILGLGSQVLLALDFEQTYWRTFLANATLFEELKEFLDDLRILKIPTAIVTDLTAQIQFRKIVYFGLDHYFDYIITSEEAGCDKPHGAPFYLALHKMRLNYSNVWMIGDDKDVDILGAREQINAITIQKIHDGVVLGEGKCLPDACFMKYQNLRRFLSRLS